MRIGIDARLYNESGVGRYIRNLLSHLQEIDTKNEYLIFHLKKDFDSLAYSNNFTKVLADFRWYSFIEQIKFPKLLNKFNLDLMHFPHFNTPIFYKGKFIVTIHDLIHQHFSMQKATTHDPITYKIKKFGYKTVFKNAIKKSEKVITVSNFVKNQLIGEWGIDENKIIVTEEAVDEKIIGLAKNLNEKRSKQILEKFNIHSPFIFYVGNAHPHKNVEGLIKAFLEIKEENGNLQLVLSGSDHYFWQKIKQNQEDIIFTGYVTDEELVALYKNAKAFVMPSYEEGFGIPLLEAFASGCPVVSSNAGSLPEVGGDACLYFDPKNEEDMKEKTTEVLNNQKLRGELIEKGYKRYKKFSWKKLAKETLQTYNKNI